MQLLHFACLIGFVAVSEVFETYNHRNGCNKQVARGDSSSASSSSSSKSGTGTVGVSTVTGTGTCIAGTTDCTGTLQVCKNSASPASSGLCTTFASTTSTSDKSTFSFSYENANVPSVAVTCPGTCYISVRQDTNAAGVVTVGIVTTSSLVVTGSTSYSSSIVTLGGFTIPVTGTIDCSGDD